jgi:hypothetical protein
MDIVQGLLLLITLATLVTTLALWKQRVTPLVDKVASEAVDHEESPHSSLEPTTRPMRVAVLDDETAARRERQAREKAPNPELAQ